MELAKENAFFSYLLDLCYGSLLVPMSDGKALLITPEPRAKHIMKIYSQFSFDTPALFHEMFQAQVYKCEYAVQHGDIVIDCGAHVGTFTVKTAEKADLVISIEPVKENPNSLRENVKCLKLKNVIVIGEALSSKAGFEYLLVSKRSRTSQLPLS